MEWCGAERCEPGFGDEEGAVDVHPLEHLGWAGQDEYVG